MSERMPREHGMRWAHQNRPRWTKLRRDVWLARGRMATMVLAMAVSLTGVGALLSAKAVADREIAANYAGTRPASATIELADPIDPALLAQVRARPGISDAAARQTVMARFATGPDSWGALLLFVVPEDDPRQVATFRATTGPDGWPPSADGLLLERSAVAVTGVGPGGRLVVQTPHGTATPATVAGLVHDPSLAPAIQEREGYGYVTPAGLARLGEPVRLDQLKIVVADRPGGPPSRDAAVIEARAHELAVWLGAQGHPVRTIEIPPPYRHPHQRIMDTMVSLLLIAAAASLLLSAVLVATMLRAMLAAQVRQIGVLKAVGARTGQVLTGYLVLVTGLGAVASAAAVVPALLAGRALTGSLARLLNLDIGDPSAPGWVVLVVVAAGLVVPPLVASGPLVAASRTTVRAALDDHGVSTGRIRIGTVDRLAARSRTFALALRDARRRRGRFALAVGLLATSGALFLTAVNTGAAWQRWVDDGLSRRSYDLEVRLTEAYPAERITAALSGLPAVRGIETLTNLPVAVARPDGIDVAHTYPDQGHGSFTLTALPPGTDLVHFPLRSGRWLAPGDSDAVVLNQQVHGYAVGDPITLSVNGRSLSLRVVGLVNEVGAAGTAYVAAGGTNLTAGGTNFAAGGPAANGGANAIRIVTGRHDDTSRRAALSEVEHALAGAGVRVARSLPITELRQAVDEHVSVLLNVILGLAAMTATVGLLGLAALLTITVVERTREFAVLHTLGATPAVVRRIVVTQAVLIATISVGLGALGALPLSAGLGRFVGQASFGVPLPTLVSPGGLLLWTAGALIGGAAASLAAARRAARLTVAAALAVS